MNNPFTYSDILAWIITTDDAFNFTAEIDLLVNQLFSNSSRPPRGEAGNPQEILSSSFSHTFVVAISKAFTAASISWDDHKTAKDFLLGLKDAIRRLKIMKLTIAFKPTQQFLAFISHRIENDVNEHIILDIGYDPMIIGGALIIFEGAYKNLTLPRLVGRVFEEHKDKIGLLI